MSVSIKDHTPKLLIGSQRVANLAVRFASDDVLRFARKKTPYSGAVQSKGGKSLTGGGHLRNDTIVKVKGGKARIKWGKRYAAAQEAGMAKTKRGTIVFKNYTTPGTGPHYAENAINKVDANSAYYIRKASRIL